MLLKYYALVNRHGIANKSYILLFSSDYTIVYDLDDVKIVHKQIKRKGLAIKSSYPNYCQIPCRSLGSNDWHVWQLTMNVHN